MVGKKTVAKKKDAASKKSKANKAKPAISGAAKAGKDSARAGADAARAGVDPAKENSDAAMEREDADSLKTDSASLNGPDAGDAFSPSDSATESLTKLSESCSSKDELRAAAKQIRHHAYIKLKDEDEQKAYSNLCSLIVSKGWKTVLFYVSKEDEFPTHKMLSLEVEAGRAPAIPKSEADEKSLTPYYFESIFRLRRNKRIAVLEPADGAKECLAGSIDAVIVPGLAFDFNGDRLGYGAGYYDRFLKGFTGLKIGLCYEQQVVKKILAQEHDVKMDYILTARKLFRCNKK